MRGIGARRLPLESDAPLFAFAVIRLAIAVGALVLGNESARAPVPSEATDDRASEFEELVAALADYAPAAAGVPARRPTGR